MEKLETLSYFTVYVKHIFFVLTLSPFLDLINYQNSS